MRGIQRVPSLLYHNPSINSLNKHLAEYEISSIEPMHDICGHIKNIFIELPCVLNENEKKVFNEIYQITIGNKQCKRACDYRLALLDIVLVMKNILQLAILELLLTLVEIQRICYSPEKKRTSKQILKLYNITFKHVYIMKNLFRKVNKISWGKLYGKYFHQIICDGPQQYRLVSGTASNCEAEERVFNTIKGITNTTSSRHPSHIINNIILRCQSWENCLINDICLPSYGVNIDLSLNYMIQEETSRENEMNEEINGNIEETILRIQEIEEDEKKEYIGEQEKESDYDNYGPIDDAVPSVGVGEDDDGVDDDDGIHDGVDDDEDTNEIVNSSQ